MTARNRAHTTRKYVQSLNILNKNINMYNNTIHRHTIHRLTTEEAHHAEACNPTEVHNGINRAVTDHDN